MNKWIKIEDQLPTTDPGNRILCLLTYKNGLKNIMIGQRFPFGPTPHDHEKYKPFFYFSVDLFLTNDIEITGCKVIAWQPLPEIPDDLD